MAGFQGFSGDCLVGFNIVGKEKVFKRVNYLVEFKIVGNEKVIVKNEKALKKKRERLHCGSE